MNFQTIDRLRLAAGMSVSELSKRSGVAYSTYWFIRTGRSKPQRKTLQRYLAALSLGEKKNLPANGACHRLKLIRAAYRGHIVAVCAALGLDAEEVSASDPKRSATQDPKWAAAAKVRAMAIYCTSVEFDIPGAELARAIGMTKQAVSWNLKRVGDLTEDAKFGPLLELAGRLISARPPGSEMGEIYED